MKNPPAKLPFFAITLPSTMLDYSELGSFKTRIREGLCRTVLTVGAIAALLVSVAVAQQASSPKTNGVTIQGNVLRLDRKPVGDAVVTLEKADTPGDIETRTNPAGAFVFSSLTTGSYRLTAEKSGSRSRTASVSAASENGVEKIELVLQVTQPTPAPETSSAPAGHTMEFADQPNFTVAGVTDWTAVGGHGSDSTLRTSESLASETATLKQQTSVHNSASDSGDASKDKESENKLRAALAGAPSSFEANHQLGEFYLRVGRYQEAIPLLESAYRIDPSNEPNQYDLALGYQGTGDVSKARGRIREFLVMHQSADLHRLAGELDEKLGDPLSAVHEYEQAVKLDPSEQNYFEWGSELLLHRAVWQAQEVFHKGAEAYPKSARMQTALGTALFSGARYEEAALHLCDASNLNPLDPNPYIFMGKVQMAAPNSLACVQPMLARFVQQQPSSSIANYLYAMSILKHQEQAPDKQAVQQAEALLTKAVTLDSKCSEAYLQLGILSASQRSFDKAIGFYSKAIEADPQLADAYYRMGVAYDRTGQPAKAKQEFQLHDEIKQRQAADTERQRREVKQFLVVQPGEHASPAAK